MNIDIFYDTSTTSDRPQHPLVIEDVVSMARCTLETAGPIVAMYWISYLKDVIQQKTWRSEAAADLLQEIMHGVANDGTIEVPIGSYSGAVKISSRCGCRKLC